MKLPGCKSALNWLFLGWVATAVLSGCAQQAPGGFRDIETPIASTTRFDLPRFDGDWVVRAAFPGDEALRAVALVMQDTGGRALELFVKECPANGACTDRTINWPAEQAGQARFKLDLPNRVPHQDMWVLWVDADYRTAAVGAPDGRFGWILDRRYDGGADRIKAARDILDFNGYDVERMVVR